MKNIVVTANERKKKSRKKLVKIFFEFSESFLNSLEIKLNPPMRKGLNIRYILKNWMFFAIRHPHYFFTDKCQFSDVCIKFWWLIMLRKSQKACIYRFVYSDYSECLVKRNSDSQFSFMVYNQTGHELWVASTRQNCSSPWHNVFHKMWRNIRPTVHHFCL